MSDMAGEDWRTIAKKAQDYRDASIARIEPAVPHVHTDLPLNVTHIPRELLSQAEVTITESTSEELLAQLAQGSLTCLEVTTAFLRRAGLAQALTNCITEALPERALDRARSLDLYLSEHGKPIGPLHGLPISVKEHISMKGLGVNAAFVSWWDHVADRNAPVLDILWNAGCVFYARTTQPQTLMHLETSSNLYGETVNPHNRRLTSGGSSGGEGALLGMHGSCLGLGTDIGGSIRSPAANCGVYGFRPTTYRIPGEGCATTDEGQEQVVPVLGPLSTSLEAIKLFFKTVIAAKPWLDDPSLIPLPWRDNENFFPDSRVKVAVMWHDGVVKPHPPVTRALNIVVEKLKLMPNVQVVDWEPFQHDRAWELVSSLYFPDGGVQDIEALEASGEPLRPLTEFILKHNPHVKHLTVRELWELTIQREEYRTKHAQVWNSTASRGDQMVDVILCPVGPGTAPLLNHARYWPYTSHWNLVDHPALVFPVTKADPALDPVEADFRPMSASDEENHKAYENTELYIGAPVSLQLVGRRYEDEKVLSQDLSVRQCLPKSVQVIQAFELLRQSFQP